MDFIDLIDSYSDEDSKIAQIYRDSMLTYKELKTKSDALACYLIEKFGQDKSPILIYGHKQNEMLVSFLACTKAGHAYIPVDVTFPSARVNDIIESAGSKILLNIGNLEYKSDSLDVINIDEINEIVGKRKGNIPDSKYKVKQNENYYIIYTSGSTGKPKGVQITKECIETFMRWFTKSCELTGIEKIVMNQVSYSFDVSVISIYIGLSTGKTLYVIDKDMVENYQEFFDNLRKSNISLWVSTPSLIEMCMLDESFNSELLPNLQKVILAGEVLTKKLLSNIYKRFPNVKVINGYGPTEATVLATAVEITDEIMKSDKPIPIGYGIEGGKIIFLDNDGKEVADGEKGELVIVGSSVSVGYYNNEEQTKKAFFTIEENGKLMRAYKTGDLAFRDIDGLIYYSGRKDFQIKLNGYRIEIEDIENNIRKLDSINNVVVLPVYREEKISHLMAYITLTEKTEEKEFKVAQKIKEELKKLIPSYMVPRTIKIRQEFPINSNGKINRKLLMEELSK